MIRHIVSDRAPVIWRYLLAILLLTVPLLHLPLAFGRLTGTKLPFFGTVTAGTTAEIGVLALAVVLLFAGDVCRELRSSRLLQVWCIGGVLLLAAALYRQFIHRDVWSNVETALMYTLLPPAAAVLKTELRKLLPAFSMFTLLLAIISGIFSENFTGFTGNWNWTQAILIASLPGAAFFCRLKRPLYWSIGAALLIFLLFYLKDPALLSRATALAALLTALWLFAAGRIPEKFQLKTAISVTAVLILLLFIFISFCDLPDSRVQLWKGAFALFAELPLTGTGALYRFPEFIAPFLPEKYFFSPFAAPLHTHAHNEFLSMACSYGISGIFYLGTVLTVLFYAAMRCTERTGKDLPVLWWGFIIFICGQFDLTASLPAGAAMLLIASALALSGDKDDLDPVKPVWQQQLAAALLLVYICGNITAACRAGWHLRQGQLAMRANDIGGAVKWYESSIAIRASRHALYELAEIELGKRNSPQRTFGLLYQLEEELGSTAYLHTNRLKAVALVQLRQPQKAEEFLKAEMTHYPYSIINARLHWLLLRILRRPRSEVTAAYQRLLTLCALRKISPADAAKITPPQDDSALEAPLGGGR